MKLTFSVPLEEQISADVVRQAQGNIDTDMDISEDQGILKSIRC